MARSTSMAWALVLLLVCVLAYSAHGARSLQQAVVRGQTIRNVPSPPPPPPFNGLSTSGTGLGDSSASASGPDSGPSASPDAAPRERHASLVAWSSGSSIG